MEPKSTSFDEPIPSLETKKFKTNRGYETISEFMSRYSIDNGIRFYLTKYIDFSMRARYSYANDKMIMLIHDFAWYNYLDDAALNFLINIPYSVSSKVMDHGFFIAANRNSAVVTSRIRLYLRKLNEEESFQ